MPWKRSLNWLESRIDVFAPFDDRETPPEKLSGFAAYYLKPVRGWLGVVFVSALLLALVESSLLLVVGRFVDLLARTEPAELFSVHGGTLIAVAVGLLILRPFAHVFNEG
jgi:ATP-binding cassette subfamily B multidrug efflux pump